MLILPYDSLRLKKIICSNRAHMGHTLE